MLLFGYPKNNVLYHPMKRLLFIPCWTTNVKAYTIIHVLFCLFTLWGCKESYPNAELLKSSDFQKKASLQGEVLHLDSLWIASQIYIQDSILVVVETQMSPFVRLFNIKNGSKIGEFILAGRGPDELTACTQFQVTGDWIWAIDMVQGKYLKYRKKETLQDSFEKPVASFTLRDINIMYPIIIGSNIVAGCNLSTDSLFFFFDLEKQTIDTHVGIPFPFNIKGLGILRWRSFEYRMITDEERIYVAYCHTDLIDIYDKTGLLIRRLWGPDHFMPDFEIRGVENTGFMARPKEEARFSYFSPVITVDGLMVLYNGSLQKEHKYLNNKLFLFNSAGDPLIEFSLDTPIFNFYVDDTIKRIYGLTDNPDYQVICYDYGAYL